MKPLRDQNDNDLIRYALRFTAGASFSRCAQIARSRIERDPGEIRMLVGEAMRLIELMEGIH